MTKTIDHLNWDLSLIENEEEVCWESCLFDELDGIPIKVFDEVPHMLRAVTHALILAMESVGVSHIQGPASLEFAHRVLTMQNMGVFYLLSTTHDGVVGSALTPSDIVQHHGLCIDVAMKSSSDFDMMVRQLHYRQINKSLQKGGLTT